ncbi:MAG: hypothetical protein HQL09_00410 [Nitrospirae bacterium]|nr:hypothetical protein [Nitrospirota bacterium]
MNSMISTLNAQSPMVNASAKDAKTAAKQIERVFLDEMLRIMMEHTSFGEDKTVSTYLPVITSEMSKSLAERGGIGVADFILKGNALARYKMASRVAHQGSNEDTMSNSAGSSSSVDMGNDSVRISMRRNAN